MPSHDFRLQLYYEKNQNRTIYLIFCYFFSVSLLAYGNNLKSHHYSRERKFTNDMGNHHHFCNCLAGWMVGCLLSATTNRLTGEYVRNYHTLVTS